jgi:hypothetical protein
LVVGYTKNNKRGKFMEKAKKTTKKVAEKETISKSNSKTSLKPVVKAKLDVPVQPAKTVQKKTTLNQDLNLLIGLFSLITIITFCFAFQAGDTKVLGWELVLNADQYTGMFKGVMILYVVAIFIDCILSVRVDSENEIFNIVEKALYMFTIVSNAIVVAILLSIIKSIGIGLIIFFIISMISIIVKFARIYSNK